MNPVSTNCIWKCFEKSKYAIWKTECNHKFTGSYFSTQLGFGYSFCHYCGLPLVLVLEEKSEVPVEETAYDYE